MGATCTCSATELAANFGSCPSGTCTVDCTTTAQSPAYLGGASICAPWAYSFGFFTGIEGTVANGSPDYSKTLEIELNEINMNTASKIGNFIAGEGNVQVQYPTAVDGEDPWVAFFTGGDRIGRASGQLQNNYGGRFRLEISVNLECHTRNTQGCWQKSPRATSIPVVPIPYTERNGNSLYDVNFATIRIAAYDPDIGDVVYYFHASNRKYGVLVGHGIPEGDYPNNPTPAEYNAARNSVLDQECNNDCTQCPSPLLLTGPGNTVESIENFCEQYPVWTTANVGQHTAGPPERMMIDPFTGVVHWQTGRSPFLDDTPNPALGTGGYTVPDYPVDWEAPGGTGTPYYWEQKGGMYDGYVYDKKNFEYKKYSEYSKCESTAGAEYSGLTCTTPSLTPGFYNLVLDIRSQSGDSCLFRDLTVPVNERCMSLEDIISESNNPLRVEMTDPLRGIYTPSPGQVPTMQSSQRGYNTIPLDFLIYLYPSMAMCHNCNGSDTAAGAYVGDGIVTYRDSTGTYGHDVTQSTVAPPNVDKYHHKPLYQGTGRCIICGGSETNSSQIFDPNVCNNCLEPNIATCVYNTRPFWINKDYSLNNDPYTPAPVGWGPSDTYPSGNPADGLTAWGNLAPAQVTAFKGAVVEFDLVAGDEDECVELFIYDTGLYRAQELDFCNPNVNPSGSNADACAVLDPGGRPGILDDLPSDIDASLDMFDMYLGPHQAAYVPGFNDTTKPAVLGEPGKTVRRSFRWPAVTAWPANIESDYDPRPVDSTVCFVAFDGYLFSDFRCVRITLNTQQQIYWSDRRPGLDPANVWNVVQDQPGFNTGTYTDVVDGVSVNITAPVTYANQTRMVVNVGDMITFDVQAKQASGYDPLDIFVSQGVLPEGSTFEKSATIDNDPVRYTFSWRPTKGQECEYRICFLASNIRGMEYPMVVGYGDLVTRGGPSAPSVREYRPSDSTSATAPFVDERCYTIEVTDSSAYLADGAYIDVDSGADAVVSALDSDCGYSIGGWFFPEEVTNDMAIFTLGHDTAGALTPVHQLRWINDLLSDDIMVGTDSVPTVNTGTLYRSLAFYENGARILSTPPVACDGEWHYFYATVGDDNMLTLYLDGVQLMLAAAGDRHEFADPPMAMGAVTAFGNVVPAGAAPVLRFGADSLGVEYDGWLNDVRVYSRALTSAEVGAQMYATCSNDDAARDMGACLALEDPAMAAAAREGLELWLNFNDANNANPTRTASADGHVHGSTLTDGLPADSSYSVYLSCSTTRDTRDLVDFGGVYEYCNDYQSLMGSRTDYQPDMYSEAFRTTNLPQCPEHMCYAKEGPAAGAGLSLAAGSELVCSYQCSDTDNSFHGAGFSTTLPVQLGLATQTAPFVSSEITTGNWQVVGSLLEMDSPYGPYRGEMSMAGVAMSDKSGKVGRTASAVIPPGATATVEYKVSPQFGACPATPVPNVVHVDGGQQVVIRGSNFAESATLACHWGGMGSTPARVVEYDSRGSLRRPSAVACTAPGGYGAATAAALEVSNNGADFSDFGIPVYFTESAAYFDGTELVEVDPTGAAWLDGGLSLGAWFNMHEPPPTRFNGLPLVKPVTLFALEWDDGGANDEHLAVGYNVNGLNGHQLEVLRNGAVAMAPVEGQLSIEQGTSGWHHVMVTLTPEGELTLFLDGAASGSVNVTMPDAASAKLWVGGRVGDNPTQSGTTMAQYSEFVGYMDKLAMFGRPLAACEVGAFMWGNATRSYGCPGGSTEAPMAASYMPLPGGLIAHFGFDGRYYEHGSKLTTPGGFDVYAWDPVSARYSTQVSVGEGWMEPVGDGVLLGSMGMSDGNLVGDTLQYGGMLDVTVNATTLPGLGFVTTPYLPPSFNAARRKVCGNVRIAVGSRLEATDTAAQSLSQVGNFMYADVNGMDLDATGYSGTTLPEVVAEPAPVPNRCEQHHPFLSTRMVPVEGLALPEPYVAPVESCVEQGATVFGFGFAKSKWLRCMQGDAEGELSPTAAHFINAAEVRCSTAPTDLPYHYKFAVSNNYVADSGCEDAPEPVAAETPEHLYTKDASLFFDGEHTYVVNNNGLSDGLNNTGVTFGAWFFPTRALVPPGNAEEQEPVVAFSTECGSVVPVFNSADGAPPTAVVVGATYVNGRVCLTSDLPYYSQHDIPAHPELDLPTKWDATYGLLDSANASLCLPADPGMWHYVEVSVAPKEILMDIPSDEPKVSYIATLKVDGLKLGVGPNGAGDASLRVPALPVDDGAFFVGGVHCPSSSASPSTANQNAWEGLGTMPDHHLRYFRGMIDEVRVYAGVQGELDWMAKAAPAPELLAYYTFAVTRGDNQRRQTPHCDEFVGVDAPADCIVGGAYFARAVEEHWMTQPPGLRYSAENLATFPRPTGYHPVARGSPLAPAVYPDLVTHTIFGGAETCATPTISDASYAGTSVSHQNLLDDPASFPLDYSTATKHPYAQRGPTRFNHFLPSEPGVVNYRQGPGAAFAAADATIYKGATPCAAPDFRYMEVPWHAATLEGVDTDASPLDGGKKVAVTGYNIAPSKWLACKWRGLKYEDMEFSLDEAFARYEYVIGTGGWEADMPGTVMCDLPGTSAPGSDWLKVPGVVGLQLVSPKARGAEMVMFKEMALSAGGGMPTTTVVEYGSENFHHALNLACPDGLRFDEVLFASYGRPAHRCNKQRVRQCNGAIETVGCDWAAWKATSGCDSDARAHPGFTAGIVASYCAGKAECSIPAKDEVFGDPCSSKNKWLAVAMTCTDRWAAKDYARLSGVDANAMGALLNPAAGERGEYSFSAWVKPGNKVGRQAVASFGCTDCAKMNRGLLQWVGLEENVGQFHYYDDYINDVAMKREDGSDILLAAGQWYMVTWTIMANNDGALYLNGHKVASFCTAARPLGGPGVAQTATFTLGMDLNDHLMPAEYFAGLIDEVRVFNRSLTAEEVFASAYWTPDMGAAPLVPFVAAYWKFNNLAEPNAALATDESGNGFHLMLPSSSVDVWDPASLAFVAPAPGADAPKHVEYEYHGGAWFPATNVELELADSAPAPLGGELAEMTLSGVNYVKGMSRVYYDGADVSSDILEVTCDAITMFVPAATCGGDGDAAVSATNVAGGPAVSVPEETVAQEATVPDLQAGLTCYLPFLGSPMDWSGRGNDAELVDGATLTADRNGRAEAAYAFDGDDSIAVPACAPAALSGKTIATVAMWVRYADVAFPDCQACSEFPSYEAEIGFRGCVMEPHAIMTNAWKLIAGVAAPDGAVTVYVNGVELPAVDGRLPEYLDLLARVMLDTTVGGNGFVGEIDEVWTYSRPLCAAELRKLFEVESYALEMDGTGAGAVAPVMAAAALGSPGMDVMIVPPTGAPTRLVVDFADYATDDVLVHFDGASGALDAEPTVAVPPVTAADGYSLIASASIYAPHTDTYYLQVTVVDEVRCTLTADGGATLMSVDSGQPGVLRNHERHAHLMAGQWYALRCAFTKLPTGASAQPFGHLALKWRSANRAVGPAFRGPHIRTGGLSELVAAAWVHPYSTEGRVGLMALMGDEPTADDADVARFGLSVVDGALSAALFTGKPAGKLCDAAAYREHRSWKTPIAAGEWSHVVVVYDGMRLSFFLNGVLTEEVDFPTWGFLHLGSEAHFVLGADAAAAPLAGQVMSAALWNKVPAGIAAAAASWWQCPVAQASSPDLILNLHLDEGVGPVAKDFSAGVAGAGMRLFGDAALAPAARWVDATCGTHATSPVSSTYAGQALHEGLAGQCMTFAITAADMCGKRRHSGGDGFTVEVVGPLHLHSEIYELTPGDGLVDMDDGTYLAHFTRMISGYYLVYVKLDGVIVPAPDGADAAKTYVHPYVTDADASYMYDEEDMLGLDELRESCAGVPVGFVIQTVDAYNNLRTKSCDTDAFTVAFTGPYDMAGAVTDGEDGTFAVAYNAEVAGPWQMRVTATVATLDGTATAPVYHHGGRTCAGWGQSELEYCTLGDEPQLAEAGADRPLCIAVHECGSLRTSAASTYASFPDTDDLDLEGPFTMAAWVKPAPEAGQASRQYILSKQSEYSGKGYWLALLPGATSGAYTLELGIYVGSENYRIVKEMAAVPEMEWSRVGAVYDGTKAWLFVNGALLTSASWTDEAALYQRRNAQPLRVGKAFSGHIDDVMLWNVAEPAALAAPAAGMCPIMMADAGEALVAYYRFNEGAVRGADGALGPQFNAWATKDSSTRGNDGFVGLFSDETAQNKEMTIRCPPGYVIGEVLFANYGSSKGGYGTYEVDECGAENSLSYVENRCLGLNTCKVLAAYTVFGNPCKHASKSLAVNAICMLGSADPARASWAIGDPAPTHVGVPAPPALECPYDMLADLPAEFADALPAGASCDDWSLADAVAGVPEHFVMRLRDECGYVNRYPQKVDSWVKLVSPETPVLGGADPHEPVFAAAAASGELSYPHAWMAPALDTCAIASAPEHAALPVDFLWGGAAAGYPMYCRRHADKYLGTFTPAAAHAGATLTLNLGRVDGAEFTSMAVDVAPAPISAAASTTCGPSEAGPDCDGATCPDLAAEAGVEAMFEFVAKDGLGNQLRGWDELAAISVAVSGGQAAIHTVMPGAVGGLYEVYVTFPHAGNFTVTTKVGDATGCTFTAAVAPARVHAAVVYGDAPAGRFEHTMVASGADLFLFGGADKAKMYLSETWKLSTGYATFGQGFHYRRPVAVTGLGAAGGLLPVSVPTAAWQAAGRLRGDCGDVLFLSADGERLDYWGEPAGAPAGCGAAATTFWVEVPAGTDAFHLYYGNKGFAAYGSPAVFGKDGAGMFEDFEFDGSPMDNGWALDGMEHDTCTPLEPGKMGDAAAFATVTDVALSGSRSLSVDALSMMGGSIKRASAGTPMGRTFLLKGYFYDTMCDGYHYLSPDYDACMPVPNGKSMLPLKNAIGVYTDSKMDQYCHTYPWIKSGVGRESGWHSFAFVGTAEELRLYVDEQHVATDVPTDFSSMFIAGGAFVDEVTGGGKAYWDALMATPHTDGAAAVLAGEEAVFFDEAHAWTRVGLVDPPPARQAHTAVVFDGAMYIFGGERSAYYYSDIWKYDFSDDEWSFVAPRNSSAALGRHDHSAVVYGGVMYVYGGRSPGALGDFWAYDIAAGTWTAMPSSPGMAPRFGHGAAVSGGAMYVYGGYVAGAGGMPGRLTDDVWAFRFATRSWVKVGPRMDNFMEGMDKAWIADPADAMAFPQELPASRFSAVMLGRADRAGFYVVGGAGGPNMMGVLADVAGFHATGRVWSYANDGYRALEGLARYDAAGVLVDDMWACVHGGIGGGEFLSSMSCVFVGDFGLGDEVPEMPMVM